MTELGHLLLADTIFRRLNWPQDMRAPLYLGAIAPDAHRVTIDVSYRDIHFRSRRRPGHRLADFVRLYLRPALHSADSYERAFFVGWLSHLCGDDAWRQKIRAELESLWRQIYGANRLERSALRAEFYDECDWVDMQLYQANANLVEDIRWILEQAVPRFTVPPLHASDIHRWRQQVIEEKLPPSNFSIEQPRFIDVDFILDAMTIAEEEAVAMIGWEMKRQPAEPAPDETAV